MGKKSRRARGDGRRGTPNSNANANPDATRPLPIEEHEWTRLASKVASLTRHLLEDDEKIKKEYADGTLTVETLRAAEPTLRTAVARALGLDEAFVKKAVNDTLLAYTDEFTDKKNEAAKRRAPPSPPASESVEVPLEHAISVEDPQAQRIAIALAKAKATAKAASPHKKSSANTRFSTALNALRDTILIDKDDRANMMEYLNSHIIEDMEAEQYVKIVARWPRLRKYWPRLRRRICSYCCKITGDLSARRDGLPLYERLVAMPRLLVCGGCGQGRGVGRYCSEECQRAHWPEHQRTCPAALLAARMDEKFGGNISFEEMAEAAGCTVEEIEAACLRGFRRSSACDLRPLSAESAELFF